MAKRKRKLPKFIDVIRLGEVLVEVVRALLSARKGDRLRLSIDLKRSGDKPWQLKPTGDAKVEVLDAEDSAITAVDRDTPTLAPGKAD